ncbi:serine/threonine-protein kinase [Streptomyces sp. NPDC090025]|uniref:serine/threonine-protein kinase n=1 Tax=Streptomyces sp. NPDC090025 TaxID=3365922 RepID=UPI00383345AB
MRPFCERAPHRAGRPAKEFQLNIEKSQVLNRFELLDQIGEGSQGQLYIGRDTNDDSLVAVKLQRPRTFESTRTFGEVGEELEKEAETAQALAGIQGVPERIASGVFKGRYGDQRCFVMELVNGTPLYDVLMEFRPVPLMSAVAITGQLCEILDRVHEKGWLHCDVKPENVMLEPDGSVRILDLGLAGRIGERPDWPKGSPGYAPPEQYEKGALTETADIFALGCLLLEMTVMHLPYAGTLARPGTDWPVLPPDRLRLVPPEIRSLVLRMVDLEPLNRPARMREVFAGLRPLLPPAGQKPPDKRMSPDPTAYYRAGRATL